LVRHKLSGAGKQLGDEVWAKLQDGWQGTNWINEMTKRRTDDKSLLNITGEVKISFTQEVFHFDQDGVLAEILQTLVTKTYC
jgi:hypothetical protein